jgi:Protein of unknown function/Domain of unknown function (DUF1835)
MKQTIAHFVFTLSGAGCLLQALRQAGRDDQVVLTDHGVNVGPIASDRSERAKWLERELGVPDRGDTPRSERNWDESRFPGYRKVAWLTRRSAMEYAGFLDWSWHRGDTPFDLVDLGKAKISYPEEHGSRLSGAFAGSLDFLGPETIAHNRLWDLAAPLQPAERLRHRERWGQLLLENAPLRVLDGGELVSVPISFFDEMLMSLVTDHWQQVSRIIGNALAFEVGDGIVQIGIHFLSSRLDTMAKNGRLEIRGGSAHDIGWSEVRLPAARQPSWSGAISVKLQ